MANGFVVDRLLEGLPYGLKELLTPSGLKGLPAPKGLDVESGLNGFALSSPRFSAWTERGSGSSRSKKSKTTGMASLATSDSHWTQPTPRMGISASGQMLPEK